MLRQGRFTSALLAGAMLIAGTLVSVPVAQAGPGAFMNVAPPSKVELVKKKNWRGGNWHGGHWHGGGWHGGGCWNCGGGDWWVGPAVGFGTGDTTMKIDGSNNGAGILAMAQARGSATLTNVTITNSADGNIVTQPGSGFTFTGN